VALFVASAWALLPAVAVWLVTFVRTAMQDRFLTAQLPGYRDYEPRARHRLFPGLGDRCLRRIRVQRPNFWTRPTIEG
jgi:protein-S-isoprenylcysteine O-methyltransferase Ste14